MIRSRFEYMTVLLTGLLLIQSMPPAYANDVEQIKIGLNQIGTGTNASLTVELHDGKKVTGFIAEVLEEGVLLYGSPDDKNQPFIRYEQVKRLKAKHLQTRKAFVYPEEHSQNAKKWKWIGIVTGVVVVLYVVSVVTGATG